MKKSSSIFPLFVTLQTMQKCRHFRLFFLYWHGPASGKKAYKTFRDTAECHHRRMDMYIHTYTHKVDFHWGLPMKLCNLYRKTIMHGGRLKHSNTQTHTHTPVCRIHGKGYNITTGLSHMSPLLEKEVWLYIHTDYASGITCTLR